MSKSSVKIGKRLFGTLALPVLMYVVMFWLCHASGKTFFGTWVMWRSLIPSIGLSTVCAMGIGLQFKNGRFDFSGGAIMLLAAIIAGNVAVDLGNSLPVLLIVSIGVCVLCSLLVAAVYICGRMPIVIVTIGMTLFFEAVTCLIFNGAGINLVANGALKSLSSFPLVLLPFGIGFALYAFYSYCTSAGKRAVLLANNQQAAVNIGVNEKRSVLIAYVYSGILFGLATSIYCTTNKLNGAYNSLQTVGSLFNNILPVFIGVSLAPLCGDTIGIFVGAVSLCLMSFGLEAVYTAELGSALSTIITGGFLLVFNIIAGRGEIIEKITARLFSRYKTTAASK